MNIVDRLNSFWFRSFPPERLSIFRIIVGLYCLYYNFNKYNYFKSFGIKLDYLYDPVGVLTLFNNPPETLIINIILIAALISNIFFILGFLFRISGPVFSILLLFVISYSNSWSMIYHSHNIVVIHCLVLGFTRSADTFSLDRIISRHYPYKKLTSLLCRNVADSNKAWQYGWPIMLINSLTVITYFLAGIAKVMGPLGIYWALGESVRSHVAVDAIRKEFISTGAEPLAFFLYNKIYIFTAMGIGTLILEIGAPLALINRRIGKIWSILTFSLHWGIYFIMGINFRYQLVGIVFLPFFELEKIPLMLKNFFAKQTIYKS